MEEKMTIGRRIAELRRQKGLSQEAMGEALGVTRQSISKWESDGALPEIEKLVALSRLLGVSVGALLGVEEPMPADEAGRKEQGDELTQAQLRMVEEIAARYTSALRREADEKQDAAPQPSAKKRLGIWQRLALCVGGVLIVLVCVLFSRLEKLDEQYLTLGSLINDISSSVNRQVNGIAVQVRELLNAQNALTTTYGASVAAIDVEQQSFILDAFAVPKTYEAGMEVEFFAECGGEIFYAQGIEGEAARFSAQLAVPLTDERISVYAAFTRSGVRETQLLDQIEYAYTETTPSLTLSSFTSFNGSGGAFALDGTSAIVHYWAAQSGAWRYIPEAPRIAELRVGLFINKSLALWAAPTDESPEVQMGSAPDVGAAYSVTAPGAADGVGTQVFEFPQYEFTLNEGDMLVVAAILTDQFGNERIYTADYLICADGGLVKPASVEDTQEGWTY